MARRWLLLIHRLPPKPDYLRVKLRRRLQGIGAVPLKRTVYVLPLSEQSHADFEWLAREITADGGEATVCEAAFLDETTDRRLIEAFQSTRAAAYAEIEDAARRGVPDAERLERRLAAVTAQDHFGAPGRPDAEAALEALVTRRAVSVSTVAATDTAAPRGRTWVTRTGVYMDRIASAWLIRRFIDPEARFRFVAPKGYRPEPGDLRFDMFEGEYTHEGERCTFETLYRRFKLADAALTAIGEIVHDIDFKDNRFDRPETAGIRMVLDGIARSHPHDATRLERGAAVLDDLYGQFRKGRK
ncbi:MAG: chromate resistance protein ChrB domain-containing protein [Gemmatimonadales bacterium]